MVNLSSKTTFQHVSLLICAELHVPSLRYVMLAKINGIFVWRERMPRRF